VYHNCRQSAHVPDVHACQRVPRGCLIAALFLPLARCLKKHCSHNFTPTFRLRSCFWISWPQLVVDWGSPRSILRHPHQGIHFPNPLAVSQPVTHTGNMQQLGPGQGYLSDHSGSSQYAAHASRERNDFSRAGQEYYVHPMERPQFDGRSHFDGRLGAESRGRPAAGLEFSSRGSEHSLSQALSSRSPARKLPMNSIMCCQYCRYPRLTVF
jgi:hypothetical protein